MELAEVVQRVVWRHKVLIVALVLVCIAGGLALNFSKPTEHVATTRISIDGGTSQTPLTAKADADSALAIVTSRDAVASALHAAGSKEDPTTYGASNVTLVPVGTSGVVDLSVKDASARSAVTVANKLAQSLIDIRQQISGNSVATVISNLNAELAQSNSRVQDFQSAIAASADGPDAARRVLLKENATAQLQQHDLQVQHDAIQQAVTRGTAAPDAATRLSGLNSRLAAGSQHITELEASINDTNRSQGEQANLLQQELNSTLQQQVGIRSDRQRNVELQAALVKPVVIGGAAKVAESQKSTLPSTLVLAGLLGLILGLAAASVLETLRPSVVGAEALARVFGTSVLATLTGPPDNASPVEVGVLSGYLRLAASARGIDRVELLTVDDKIDLERLALRLGDHLVASPEVAVLHLADRAGGSVAPFDARLNGDSINDAPESPAMVLFAPKVTKRRALDPIANLLALTGWPLLGVVTYDRSGTVSGKVKGRGKDKDTGKSAEHPAPIDIGVSERPSVRTG